MKINEEEIKKIAFLSRLEFDNKDFSFERIEQIYDKDV